MADGENPNSGHNSGTGIEVEGLTQERFAHHVAAITRQKAAVVAEREKLNKLRKSAKADGIVLKELDATMIVADMNRVEQEEYVERTRWYLEMLRVPAGSQMTLKFEKPKDGKSGDKKRAEQAAEEALGKGYRAGLEERPDSENPYQPNTDEGQAWLKGRHDGLQSLDEQLQEQALKDESVNMDEDPLAEGGDEGGDE